MSLSKLYVLIIAGSVAIALAGCGGSSTPSTTHTIATPTSATTKSSAGGSASSTTGPVRATLRGANHTPTAGKLWAFSLRVDDASGRPLDGAIEIEFTLGGQVVGRDTPPTHSIKHGVWHEKLTFPSQAIAEPLNLQAVVHTSKGSATLDWPVTVKP